MMLKRKSIKSLLRLISLSPLFPVPVLAPTLAAVILGEIGDINRFSNSSKLAVYAGIDVNVNQSGESKSQNGKMSKRGSPYLRKALFQAAMVVAFIDPTFSAFYQKKRSEDKRQYTSSEIKR